MLSRVSVKAQAMGLTSASRAIFSPMEQNLAQEEEKGGSHDIHLDLSDTHPGNSTSTKPEATKSAKMRQKRMEFVRASQGKTCLKQQELQIVMVSSKDVPNDLIQDKSRPMTIVGSDVVSLYPNLTWESAGEQVYQAYWSQ